MQEKTDLARPYAKAAFEHAVGLGKLKQWSDLLHKAALIVKHPQMADLLIDPRVTCEQVYELICDLSKEELDGSMRNFLRLLAENERLVVLPEIASLFSKLQAEYEQTLQVQVLTVIELTKAQQEELAKVLQQRLARKIILNFALEPKLLGGILIRAGDKVIDLSLRGQLQRLNNKLRTV